MSTPKYTRTDSATARPDPQVPSSPNVPIATAGLEPLRWQQGERFGGAELPLGDLGGASQIGVNLVELAPGRQSCPLHYHLREEEHFYVLGGRCVLRVDDARHPMGPGDYVCFPAGTRVAHCFENPYDEPCKLLAIGSRIADEVAVYPESQKMKLRALGLIVPLPDATLDYWQGERPDEPLPGTAAARERAAAEQARVQQEASDRRTEQQREVESQIEGQVESELAEMKRRLGLT